MNDPLTAATSAGTQLSVLTASSMQRLLSSLKPGTFFPDVPSVITAAVRADDPLAMFTAPRPRQQRASASGAHTTIPLGLPSHQQTGAGEDEAVLLPDPANIDSTFYRTRRGALRAHGYGLLQPHTDADANTVPERVEQLLPPSGDDVEDAEAPTEAGVLQPLLCATPLAVDASDIVVGCDMISGTGAKLYSVLRRMDVFPFLARTPESRRNVYVCVDPEVPLDPFFDIDFALPPAAAAARSSTASSTAASSSAHITPQPPAVVDGCTFAELKQRALHDALLLAIVPALEAYFGTSVHEIAVFDASSEAGRKISFHVHCRMSDRQCFRNMREHRSFGLTHLNESIAVPVASAFRQHLERDHGVSFSGQVAATAPPHKLHRTESLPAGQTQQQPEVELARDALALIDRGVYTSWRMFRLPHSSKRKSLVLNGPALLPFTAEDVMVPSNTGATAMFAEVCASRLRDCLSAKNVTPAERLPSEMPTVLREWLGSAPSLARSKSDAVDAHDSDAAVDDVRDARGDALRFRRLELALITRSPVDVRTKPGLLQFKPHPLDGGDVHPTAVAAEGPDGSTGGASAPLVTGVGLLIEPEPLRIGRREPITDERCAVLLRLFQVVDAHFDPAQPLVSNAVGGGVKRLSRCEYEDNGQVRMYYAMQKQCKWCVKQQRIHKSTYGQLFVTFGSIKFRCFSNDCFQSCHHLPWTDATIELRDALFPSLSLDDLQRRYPHVLFSRDSASTSGELQAAAASVGSDEEDGVPDAAAGGAEGDDAERAFEIAIADGH
jgi:hypothetical protein